MSLRTLIAETRALVDSIPPEKVTGKVTKATAQKLLKQYAQGLKTELGPELLVIWYDNDDEEEAERAAHAISNALSVSCTRAGSKFMIYYKGNGPGDKGDWNDPSSKWHY
jgi:hypothetical protein